jgi:hypothetical protein
MRLRLREMDAHSCGIHLTLMERHAASAKPAAKPAPETRAPARVLTLVPPSPATPLPVAAARPEAPVAAAPSAAAPPVPPLPAPAPLPTSVRSAPAPMVVSAAAAASAAGAVVAAVAPPAETEPTEISRLPQPETRAPGASFTLPANPLSDLDAADLASFVDFTLLETKAGAVAPAPAAGSDDRLARARRIARRAAPYAACVLVGLLLGLALRPSPKAARPAAAPRVAAPPAAAPVPPPALSPPSADELPDPVPRACVARVTTTPAGAAVFWGDIALGVSPIEGAAIPCGTAVITLRRERYAEATLRITSERGRNTVVTERLYRPPAKLLVTSSPPHAVIKLNRRSFGTAPRKISTLRFEHVRVEASLPGYRTWRKTVYLKESESEVEVTLDRLPARNARAAATPARAK